MPSKLHGLLFMILIVIYDIDSATKRFLFFLQLPKNRVGVVRLTVCGCGWGGGSSGDPHPFGALTWEKEFSQRLKKICRIQLKMCCAIPICPRPPRMDAPLCAYFGDSRSMGNYAGTVPSPAVKERHHPGPSPSQTAIGCANGSNTLRCV